MHQIWYHPIPIGITPRSMTAEQYREEESFQRLIARAKALGEHDVFMVSRSELRLICRRQGEFWAAVEGRKVRRTTPTDTSGPNAYI